MIFLLFFLSASLFSASSDSSHTEWAFSLHSGVSLGTVTVPKKKSASVVNTTYTIGGIPLVANLTKDVSSKNAVQIGGSILFDLLNSSVSQQGFRVGYLWHFWGGPGAFKQGDRENGILMNSSTSYQMSFLLQAALVNYSASSADLSTNINGSAFEGRIGLHYRTYMPYIKTDGFQLLSSIISFPAGDERIQSQTIEVTMFWMF